MDVRGVDPERVHQAGEVVGPHLHVVVLERTIGLAVASLVVVHDRVVLGEHRRGRGEVEVAEARSVDLHHMLALAADPVPEPCPVDLSRALHDRLLG